MSVMDSAAASVDADNPWLGLASFTEESRQYFFGREGEVGELTRRVQRKLLTVLFGKSGLGKTSILRAGLVPRLRAQGYFPVYLRIDYGHGSPEPAEQIKQAIREAAALGEWTQSGVAAAGESIWEFLHHRDDVLKDAAGRTLVPLLIFDQFEELFTLAQSDEAGRARAARFVEELADLVENRPPKALEAKLEADESLAEKFDFSRSDYRVVIALREDYLAPLEGLKRLMPSLAQNRLRLAPMTGTQALEAVLQPGNRLRPESPLVSEEVAEAIVRFVAGGSELANAEVEPSLLSLICRELNEQRIAQGRSEISQDLLAGSHDTILSTFYERSLADQPESVRRIIEDDLLTESGYRENLAEESLLRRFQAAGAAPDALTKLVNRRLLRIEERLDVRRVELTHDVLTGVVKASRDQRHEREAREATERALAAQRERELAARKALRRARAVAGGCALLALVAIAATVAAYFSLQRARQAELTARQTRAVSEQARQEAEGLLGYLTDDFTQELETFGRYQPIAELSQREIDYFQHLPPQLQDPATVRSGALALINHSRAAGLLGDTTIALDNANAAIALLQRGGDRSDTTLVTLGQAYTQLGWVLATLSPSTSKGHTALTRAADLLRPIAERPGASVRARRAYVEALMQLGWRDPASGQYEDAARVEREAMRITAQLRAERPADPTLEFDYANAGGWLAFDLDGLGRLEEARGTGESALAVVSQLLTQRPQDRLALLAKVHIEGALTAAAGNEMAVGDARRFAAQEIQTELTMVRLEPKNIEYVNDLGVGYFRLANALWQSGRLREAIADGRKAAETFGHAGTSAFVRYNLASGTAVAAHMQALFGDPAGAAATLAAGKALLSPSSMRASGPESRFRKASIDALLTIPAATLAYERGDSATARHIARAALVRLRAVPLHGAVQTFGVSFALCPLADIEGRAELNLEEFAAAEQAERTALEACETAGDYNFIGFTRVASQAAIRLSMALAREGKSQEAARTIDPIVTQYRGLMKKNRGDRWLPLEFAQALYAQSLTDPAHRAALLREAARLADHLTPAIARLHDTRAWRARIAAAQR